MIGFKVVHNDTCDVCNTKHPALIEVSIDNLSVYHTLCDFVCLTCLINCAVKPLSAALAPFEDTPLKEEL